MKINFLKLIRYLYYFTLIVMLILYLFPGSLIGHLLYGDFGKQPDLIPNPIGTSINHVLAFLYLSLLGLISCIRDKSLIQTIIFLISLSVIMELSHYYIPNRSFEFLDLFANLFGVLTSILIILVYKKLNEKN